AIKQALMVGSDLCGALVAIGVALALQGMPVGTALQPWWQVPVVLLMAVGCAAMFGLYSAVVRYIAIRASFEVVRTATCAAGLLYVFGLIYAAPVLQPAVAFNFGVVLVIALATGRVVARRVLGAGSDVDAERFVIFGAGEAGVHLAQALAPDRRRRVVGFVDDDESIVGSTVADLPVYAAEAMPELVEKS